MTVWVIMTQSICVHAQYESSVPFLPIHKAAYVKGGIDVIEPYEKQLLDACPRGLYAFKNTIIEHAIDPSSEKKMGYAVFLDFEPQMRIYTEESKPVKTPSYKLTLGYQGMKRLTTSRSKMEYFSFSVATGHYSNGQKGCAFSSGADDGDTECDKAFTDISDNTELHTILNRENGNFSTNLTSLSLQSDHIHYNDTDSHPSHHWIFTATYRANHNKILGVIDLGGYSYGSEAHLYGKHEVGIRIKRKEFTTYRPFSVEAGILALFDKHPSIYPYRLHVKSTLFPFEHLEKLGFFIEAVYGYDDYNYRLVDTRAMVQAGLEYSFFPYQKKR